jgi:DNA-binding transcriptional MerR regulator
MQEPEPGRSTFQTWYADNGDRLNKKRRQRYDNDAEYRQRVLTTNQNYRAKQKKEQKKERAQQRKAVRIRPTESTWKTIEIDVDGVKTPMYTIGALARAIGRGISTVRVWEREGILPPTPHRSPKGDRLYSVEAVAEIRKVLKKEGRIENPGQLRRKKRPATVDRVIKFADGECVAFQLYKVGTLAKVVDRTVVSLAQMEKSGRLPLTPLRASSLGYRLYTMRMIETVKEAFDMNGGSLRGKEWDEFYDHVERDWRSQGIFGARVLEKDDGKNKGSNGRR